MTTIEQNTHRKIYHMLCEEEKMNPEFHDYISNSYEILKTMNYNIGTYNYFYFQLVEILSDKVDLFDLKLNMFNLKCALSDTIGQIYKNTND